MVEIPKPKLENDDKTLVKVAMATLDTATDQVLSEPWAGSFVHVTKPSPLILGWHFAGTIEETKTSTAFEAGGSLAVFLANAKILFGIYSVKSNACALVPPGVSLTQVAAAATQALTALQVLNDCGGLKSGDSVLINGAAGGVGSTAVPIAKEIVGAQGQVTAVCRSTKDVEQLCGCGPRD